MLVGITMDAGSALFCLMIVLGLIIAIINVISNGIIKEKKENLRLVRELQRLESEQKRRENHLEQMSKEIKTIVTETSQKFPYMSGVLAEWQYLHDVKVAEWLQNKPRPAIKAAEEIRIISKEKRAIERECQAYKNQITFFESLFPWLEEFKELPPQEAYEYVAGKEDGDAYSRVKEWLSPEEYSQLSETDKWQLALDRYVNRSQKTSWHIGIEYERYIGYKYESKGYKVYYEGALQGLEDRGRDILVERDNDTLVIQCKRWAKGKTIHEKHIMQLFGSVAILNMEKKGTYKGVFVTTTTLSDTAKYFAKMLDIDVVEEYEFKRYPLIKCNVSQSGEKIYHLPFDQQYDRIHIDLNKGNCYVHTVAEAEEKGFRHAYRWSGNH